MSNILIVDDEKDIRELIGDILRDEARKRQGEDPRIHLDWKRRLSW